MGEGLDFVSRSLELPERDDNPERLLLDKERDELLIAAVKTLKSNEQKALWLRFGLDGEPAMTFREVGEIRGVSASRARQIICRGFRLLRHPSRSRGFSEREEGIQRQRPFSFLKIQ